MEVEKLIAGVARRAAEDLDLLFVQLDGEAARSLREGPRLIEHVTRREVIADDLEVARAEDAGVLGDLVELGEDRPLADLVRDDGDATGGDGVAEVGVGARAVETADHRDVVVVGGAEGPGRRGSIEVTRVGRLPELDELLQERCVALKFVAHAEHPEGRMVAVGGQDAEDFLAD